MRTRNTGTLPHVEVIALEYEVDFASANVVGAFVEAFDFNFTGQGIAISLNILVNFVIVLGLVPVDVQDVVLDL